MEPGRLDREVIIQKNTPTKSATGANVDAWTTLATVMAQRVDMGGKETAQAGGIISETTTIWRIRYLSTVLTTMRISYASQTWEIKSIKLLGRDDAMELNCIALG